MDVNVSNTESDAELKERAIQYILREICRKFREKNDRSFTAEEIENTLRGLGAQYLRSTLRDILKGHGLLEFNANGSLTLTDQGKNHCKGNN
jgi:hypothetical protein